MLSLFGKFLGKNRYILILIAAAASVTYLYHMQTKNVATLKERLEQRNEQIEKIKKDAAQEIKLLQASHVKKVEALQNLAQRTRREAAALRNRITEADDIVREIPNAPESQDWSSTPLPENVVSSLHSIPNSLRNSISSETGL